MTMFEEFFEMKKTPFSRDIPTNQLYLSTILEETLGRMEYAVKKQLFMVVTGACGTGKTTTVRKFRDSLDLSEYK